MSSVEDQAPDVLDPDGLLPAAPWTAKVRQSLLKARTVLLRDRLGVVEATGKGHDLRVFYGLGA